MKYGIALVVFASLTLTVFFHVNTLQAQSPDYNYVIAEWNWDGTESMWIAPDCTESIIDLRSIPQMVDRGSLIGYGFFAIRQGCSLPVGSILLGNSMSDTVTPNARLNSIMGFPIESISDRTVTGLIWSALMENSDPTGLSGPKPLIPESDRKLRLTIANHGTVKVETFNPGRHTKTVEAHRLAYDTLKSKDRGEFLHLRVASYWQEKYGIDLRNEDQIKDGLIDPETTITEDWGCPDDGTSIDCDLTWILILGTWRLNSFQAENTSNGAGSFIGLASADSALSSADMFVDTTTSITTTILRYAGSALRLDNSTETGYLAGHRANTINTYQILKVISGVVTILGVVSDSENPGSAALATTFTVQGSTLTFNANGSDRLILTDTSIDGSTTGGTYAGIFHGMDGNTRAHFNDFEASDEFATPTPTPTSTPTVGPGATITPVELYSDGEPINLTVFAYAAAFLLGIIFVWMGERFQQAMYLALGGIILVGSAIATGQAWLMILCAIGFIAIGYRVFVRFVSERGATE